MRRNASFCSSVQGTTASSSLRVLAYSRNRNGRSASLTGRSSIKGSAVLVACGEYALQGDAEVQHQAWHQVVVRLRAAAVADLAAAGQRRGGDAVRVGH